MSEAGGSCCESVLGADALGADAFGGVGFPIGAAVFEEDDIGTGAFGAVGFAIGALGMALVGSVRPGVLPLSGGATATVAVLGDGARFSIHSKVPVMPAPAAPIAITIGNSKFPGRLRGEEWGDKSFIELNVKLLQQINLQ